MERKVSIGCGNKEQAFGILDDLRKQIEEHSMADVLVAPNSSMDPPLRLAISVENDPEWPDEPLVDY